MHKIKYSRFGRLRVLSFRFYRSGICGAHVDTLRYALCLIGVCLAIDPKPNHFTVKLLNSSFSTVLCVKIVYQTFLMNSDIFNANMVAWLRLSINIESFGMLTKIKIVYLLSMQAYFMRTTPEFHNIENGWSLRNMNEQWFLPEHLKREK